MMIRGSWNNLCSFLPHSGGHQRSTAMSVSAISRDRICDRNPRLTCLVYCASINYAAETEKVDIWSLGDVLFFLWTSREPFEIEEYETEAVYDQVKKGVAPKLPPLLEKSTNKHDVALKKALDMCFILDPKERHAAKDIADMLERALYE